MITNIWLIFRITQKVILILFSSYWSPYTLSGGSFYYAETKYRSLRDTDMIDQQRLKKNQRRTKLHKWRFCV